MGSILTTEACLAHGGAETWSQVDISALTYSQAKWWRKTKLHHHIHMSDDDYDDLRNHIASFMNHEEDGDNMQVWLRILTIENLEGWAEMSVRFKIKLDEVVGRIHERPELYPSDQIWRISVAAKNLDLLDMAMCSGEAPPFPDSEKRWAADPTFFNLVICFANGVVPKGYEDVLPKDVWKVARVWWPQEVLDALPPTDFIEELCHLVAERPDHIADQFDLLVPRCTTDPRDKVFIVQGALDCQEETELVCALNTWTPLSTYS